jgi:hypothetical protein
MACVLAVGHLNTSTKMGDTAILKSGVGWIEAIQDREQRRALLLAVLNFGALSTGVKPFGHTDAT